MMKFRAIIQLSGKTATGIQVPAEVVAHLGSSKRPPVHVSISAENRMLAHVSAGDKVEVDLELDTQPREVSVPPDFLEPLDHDSDARRFFDWLSTSNKQRVVLSIEGARTTETRLRRIAKAVETLREGCI
jgi:uncharacterized protein YdeI (YjbR/CyaY-like superfamily)